MKIIILGGHGILGSHILDLIVTSEQFDITILGRDYNKLSKIKEKYKNISIIRSDVKDFDDYDLFDIVINATSSLDIQSSILEKVENSSCDFFDCHSSTVTNYNLMQKYRNSNNTYLFDCGATSFLPFINLANPVNELFVFAYYDTCWEDKSVSNSAYQEFCDMLEDHKHELGILVDNEWYKVASAEDREFHLDHGSPMYSNEILEIKKIIPALINTGFYYRMNNVHDRQSETGKIILVSENRSVVIKSHSGYYLAAAMIYAALVDHLNFKRAGSYLMGEYVNPISFQEKLLGLNINIDYETRT